MAVIGPIYGLIAAIVGLGWNWQQSDKGTQVVLASMQKDVAEVSRGVLRVERGVETYRVESKAAIQELNERVDALQEKVRGLSR